MLHGFGFGFGLRILEPKPAETKPNQNITKFNRSLTVKMDFFLFNNRFAQINFSGDS
jgi:hypothetical protein